MTPGNGSLCEYLYEQQRDGKLATTVDNLATDKFWANAGFTPAQQAAGISVLKGSADPGVGVGPDGVFLIQQDPVGIDATFLQDQGVAAHFGGKPTDSGKIAICCLLLPRM
jgi:hypothetical protein